MATVVRFYEEGEPDVLRLEEVDLGEPGPGEALLKIDTIGLNRSEASFRRGIYIRKATLPSGLGVEAAGRIIKLGPQTDGWAIGDEVFIMLAANGIEKLAVYATEAIVPSQSLFKAPGLSAAQSAASWIAFMTAWGGLCDAAKLNRGEMVIIPAGTSSVGLAAIQVALDLGAIPIAMTRDRNKVDSLRQVGATHVFVPGEDDLQQEVARLTDGKGVPLIFDPVAGPYVDTLAQCLAPYGTLIIYGGLSNQPAAFPRQLAIRNNLTLRGYSVLGILPDPPRFKNGYDYVLERLLDGRFSMPIARTFKLQDVIEAHRYLESNAQFGKILMTP